ncbi:MAG TPA: PDZ domain-containing protein [Chthoniobacteraceae bacterium]|nr:PDZ domain-containing protein [Chthoniobacteraceae bacterium]
MSIFFKMFSAFSPAALMNPRRFALWSCALLLVTFLPTGLRAKEAAPKPVEGDKKTSVDESPLSVVRVHSTNQNYDFFRPWSKRPPYQRSAIGALLPGNRVLVTAELVANTTYLELEKPDSSEKVPAQVEIVDYESNLALLKPSKDGFLEGFRPLEIEESKVGEQLHVWQLENNGNLLSTGALLTAVEVSSYPTDTASFLVYRLTSALQPREGSFTTPVVRNGKLTGLLQRFDPRSQNADVIPAPVIRHFLKAAEAQPYRGFPRAGIAFSNLRDPQLRRYAKLPNGKGGVYVTDVLKGSPGEKAGIVAGDVLLSVDGKAIDQDGNYDDARYGKISLIHYLSTLHFDGENVAFAGWRDGREFQAEVKLTHRASGESIIEPYIIDRAPRYYILGGIVLQELSRQYLREWGQEWLKKAPERFVYYDKYQQSLFADDPRERIVVISQVLPSPATLGYESIRAVEVKEINGVPLKSLDDVEKAVASPVEGFHRIKLEEDPGELILDAKEVREMEDELLKAYGLSTIRQL